LTSNSQTKQKQLNKTGTFDYRDLALFVLHRFPAVHRKFALRALQATEREPEKRLPKQILQVTRTQERKKKIS
jgi:hypothetical protein